MALVDTFKAAKQLARDSKMNTRDNCGSEPTGMTEIATEAPFSAAALLVCETGGRGVTKR